MFVSKHAERRFRLFCTFFSFSDLLPVDAMRQRTAFWREALKKHSSMKFSPIRFLTAIAWDRTVWELQVVSLQTSPSSLTLQASSLCPSSATLSDLHHVA